MSSIKVDGDLVVHMDERDHAHFQAWLDREYGHPDVCDEQRLEQRDTCQAAIYGLLIDDPDLLGNHGWGELRSMAGVP